MGQRWAAVVLSLLVWGGLGACGEGPSQIIDYSPERGAKDVSTAAPIRITFDHDVNKPSVESRLHLDPATLGTVYWQSPRQLSYVHPALRPATTYQVVLEAGYQDVDGNTYQLRHHWAFITEGPPSLSGSTPANAESGVDPATYLTLDFTREMDAASLAGAITISPAVPLSVRSDPSDGHRAIVAPDTLLGPSTTYTVTVTTAARDVDGNQIDRSRSLAFTTGAVRPLRHWIAFTADGAGGISGGLMIVNESGFPRHLFVTGTVQSFSWSPEGNRLLIQAGDDSWSAFTPGEGSVLLGFRARWAAALASGLGYVYVDDQGTLRRLLADSTEITVADNVTQAAVSPNGERLALVTAQDQSSTVWGYDIGLRARYSLAVENGLVTDLAWAPAGNRIAYLRNDAEGAALRLRSLTGSALTTTIAQGDLGAPSWLPDSTTVVFAAAIQTPNGTIRKAFLISAIAPPTALTAALGRPADAAIEVDGPVSSPDGHQIAFVSSDQIWLMNADGSRPVPLTRFDSASFPYSCRAPAWTRA